MSERTITISDKDYEELFRSKPFPKNMGDTVKGMHAQMWISKEVYDKSVQDIRLLIQDRYNHASLNDKPEVAAAMKELLERMERA